MSTHGEWYFKNLKGYPHFLRIAPFIKQGMIAKWSLCVQFIRLFWFSKFFLLNSKSLYKWFYTDLSQSYYRPISRFGKEACHKTTSCKNFFLHFKSESLRLSPSQIGEKLIQQRKTIVINIRWEATRNFKGYGESHIANNYSFLTVHFKLFYFFDLFLNTNILLKT